MQAATRVSRVETVHFYTTIYVMNLTRALSQLFLREFKVLTSGITCGKNVSPEDVLRNRANPTELMFILIPQLLVVSDDAVPDPNKYCLYQLEQLNDKNETTANVKTNFESPLTVALIMGSLVSYDYSAINLKYYPASLLPKVCVLPPPVYIMSPISGFALTGNNHVAYKSDILFYGGMNPRRERILSLIIDPLQKIYGYKVMILNHVFGEELLNYIFNTRVVLNIHYYPNSILETDRMHVALQFDHVKMVSEYPTQRDALLPTYKSHDHRILFCREIDDRFVSTTELINACVRAMSGDSSATSSSLNSTLNALCAAEIRHRVFQPQRQES